MCYHCGLPLPLDRKPGFNETCEGCGRDLHVCRNCRFFSLGRHWDCEESAIPESVSDKERRNRCDWFATAPALLKAGPGQPAAQGAAAKARSDLDKLFGG